ncbi:MAG TPA: carboxypeptidase regulatory-like domain-containing protein [Nannocystis exedens]|nr:carboxypeptidase regulatory-like domain-containing protein [Nannocystis exedens]
MPRNWHLVSAFVLAAGAVASLWFVGRPAIHDQGTSATSGNGAAPEVDDGTMELTSRGSHPARRSAPNVPTCTIHAEDIFGGIVETASIAIDGKNIGITDDSGSMTWPERRPSVSIDVMAGGYVRSMTTIACPGPASISLVPESVLAGRVSAQHAVSPLPELQVSAGPFDGRTDSAGAFVLRGIPPGTYLMTARGRNWFGTLKEPVTVGLGTVRTNLEIKVSSAFAIDGTVRGEPDLLLDGIRVRCAGVSTVTDEHGQFTIPGVSPGIYALEVAGRSDPANPSLLHEMINVSVVDRDVALDVPLGERFALEIDLADHEGTGIAGIAVELAQVHAQTRNGASCRSGSDGSCRIDGLRRGTVEIKVQVPRPVIRSVDIPSDGPVHVDINDALRTLRGRVVDRDGEPVGGRTIIARPSLPDVRGALTKSDSLGSFALENLAPEIYSLGVHTEGSPTPEVSEEIDLTKADALEAELILSTSARPLTGVVVGPQGAPVAGAMVVYEVDQGWQRCWRRSSSRTPAAVSGYDGRFTIHAIRGAAPLVLRARDGEGNLGFLDKFDPTSEAEAEIRLVETGFVAITRDEDLRREDCWLRLVGPAQCLIATSRWAKGQSAVTLDELPGHLGQLTLEVQCEHTPPIERSVRVNPGSGVDVVITAR